VAFGNRVKGFDQNNNPGGLTIYSCTSYDNGANFGLGNPVNAGQEHVLKNNISLGSIDTIANASQQNNSWNAGFSVSAPDFVSLEPSPAVIGRNPDGTWPRTDLFRLVQGSQLIDVGIDVGLPFTGSTPDLGAFETTP
jgi:hypothetical protein